MTWFYYRPINPHFFYGSPNFWDKVVLTKFISGCRMVWDLICDTSWFYKLKTEKVTGCRKSAILPNWCCLLSITVLFTHPCLNDKYGILLASILFCHWGCFQLLSLNEIKRYKCQNIWRFSSFYKNIYPSSF